MGNLFGVRRRAPVVTAQDRAILQLKQQRDKIRIYQKKTERDLEKNRDLALKLFQNNMKDRALIVLRRKKCMEETLSRTEKQLETLEELVRDIEYTQIEVSVVEGLRVGTAALKQLNSLMDIDDIQQMLQDNEEAADKQKEISDILQRTSERFDEEELLRELDSYLPKQESVEQHEEKVIEEIPEIPKESSLEEQTALSKVQDLPNTPQQLPEEGVEEKQKRRKLEPAQ